MARGRKSLAVRVEAEPHLFDPDILKLVQDTLTDGQCSGELGTEISNPTNLFTPTRFVKDESRAGAGRIAANYMGMVGPVPALPAHYTHAAIVERKRRSSSLFDFLELFAQELRSFFVAAHRKYRLPSLFQLYRVNADNKITSAIYSLMGFATKRHRDALRLHEEVPLYYAGYFADQRRPAINLELMLNDFLGIPVKVHQFHLRRLAISEDEQTRLGGIRLENSILGQTAIAGATCLNRSGSIRITIGPVGYANYLALMPDRQLYGELTELIRLYCGPSISYDIQIVLKKEEIPQTRLDSSSPVGRLGWDSWALQGQAQSDSGDTIFDPEFVKPVAKEKVEIVTSSADT
jgi:type VI secretion system protein ImpH